MTVHFASDHAGFEFKKELISFVKNELKHEVEDHGASAMDQNDDYPDFIAPAAKAVAAAPGDFAILLGGSGEGEAMVANRIPGVRAVVYYGDNLKIITLSREHNDANALSLGARFLNLNEAKDAIRLWLQTPFSQEERHQRRLQKIDHL